MSKVYSRASLRFSMPPSAINWFLNFIRSADCYSASFDMSLSIYYFYSFAIYA
jgi:hypothetical protein